MAPHEPAGRRRRRLHLVQYDWLPDPADTRIEVLLTFVIQTADGLRIEHDRMQVGLFPRATWLRLLEMAGFSIEPRSFSLPGWPRPYELLAGVRRPTPPTC